MACHSLSPSSFFFQGMKPSYRVGDGPTAKWERVGSWLAYPVVFSSLVIG